MEQLYEAVEKDLKYLRKYYSDLKLCGLTNMLTAMGMVIDPQLLTYPKEIRAKYSILIKIVYPNDFPRSPIKVFDVLKKIEWSRLPEERSHVFSDGSLCTYHPYELKKIKLKNRSLMIVNSAVRLYYAYLHYIETGQWILNDLPHGDQAYAVLQKR